MAVLERPGATIAYDDDGPAKAPVAVLLHNVLCGRAGMAELGERLRPRFRTINIDFRAHGESAAVARQFSIHDLAADVLAVLDERGIASARFVGVSLGAAVAAAIAMQQPARVEGLVLAAARCDRATLKEHVLYNTLLLWLRAFGPTAFARTQITGGLFGPTFTKARPKDVEHWSWRVEAMGTRGITLALRAWLTRPAIDAAKLRVPFLLVRGAEDSAVRDWPGHPAAVFEATGHSIATEAPGRLAELILAQLVEKPLRRRSRH